MPSPIIPVALLNILGAATVDGLLVGLQAVVIADLNFIAFVSRFESDPVGADIQHFFPRTERVASKLSAATNCNTMDGLRDGCAR